MPADIYNLLSPIALAHLISCDGTTHHSGLLICLDNFTIPEVVRFINVLIIRYNISCTLRIYNSIYPRVYIQAESLPHLRSIVLPHLHPFFHYKLFNQLANST